MAFAAALMTFGAVLIYSGWKSKSIVEVIQNPGAESAIPADQLDQVYPAASGGVSQLSGAQSAGGPSAAGGGDVGGLQGLLGTQGTQGVGGMPVSKRKQQLMAWAHIAQTRYHLTVREMQPFDRVDPVHAPRSLHYSDRAFDASGSQKNMQAFAAYMSATFGHQLTELFWRGPGYQVIKNGVRQNRDFVTGHTDHVHVGL